MDDETRAALELTDDQLRGMRDAADPAVVAKRPKRPRDLNQLAASVVEEATAASMPPIRVPADVSAIRITGVTIGPEAERFQVEVSSQAF